MFLDTGATRSVITPRVAKELGLTVSRSAAIIASSARVSAGAARLTSLQVGNDPQLRVEDMTVLVMDLPVTDGALGLDYLGQFSRVCYHIRENILELTTL